MARTGIGTRAATWAILAAGIVMWLVVGPVTKVPLWGDEGQHLNGARHVLLSADRWFCPVFDPRDSEGWTAEEIQNCHFPPTLISIYALSLSVFSPGSPAFGTPVLVAHLVAAVGLFFLCRRLFGMPTAGIAVILWMWAPVGFRRGSQIMAEPFLVACGIAALAFVVEAIDRKSRGLAAAAGACLGLAFLFKLWIAGPFVLMSLAVIAAGQRGERGRLLLPLAAGGLITGGLHLAAVAVAEPELFSTWATIYFDLVISRLRAANHPLVEPSPAWSYVAELYRDYWPLALPITAFAWGVVFRRSERSTDRAARNLFLAALVALAMLSIYESKMPLYVYYLAPVFALAAARGVTLVSETAVAESPSGRAGLWGAATTCLFLSGAAWMGLAQARWPAVLTLGFCVVHTLAALWFLFLLRSAGAWRLESRIAGLLAVPLAVGLITGVETARASLEDPVAPVAEYFNQAGGAVAPSEVRFVSPRWHALGFHLWQQGRPWAVAGGESIEAGVLDRLERGEIDFVEIDRDYRQRAGALPDVETHNRVTAWLHRHATDVTGSIEQATGRRLKSYVFISGRSALAAAGLAKAPAGGLEPSDGSPGSAETMKE